MKFQIMEYTLASYSISIPRYQRFVTRRFRPKQAIVHLTGRNRTESSSSIRSKSPSVTENHVAATLARTMLGEMGHSWDPGLRCNLNPLF